MKNTPAVLVGVFLFTYNKKHPADKQGALRITFSFFCHIINIVSIVIEVFPACENPVDNFLATAK